jgi:selenocysteine lyase/cysteine desulfurase
MSLNSQKHLFDLEEGITYLNCAAYSPLLNSVIEAGEQSIRIKARPYNIVPKEHFFDVPDKARALIGQIINAKDSNEIALLPSVSYGLAIVAKNLHRVEGIRSKANILIISEEFPNNIYIFERTANDLGLELITLSNPNHEDWNDYITNAITEQTALVVMPHVHWIHGIKFDIKSISQKCVATNALFVIDGTQSVGAYPIDVQDVRVDALIGASYKWLLGPYGNGYGYFGSFFNEGIPLEEAWVNKVNSDLFADLLNYERAYRPLAQRYNAGEYSQFIQVPMCTAAYTQILNWGVHNIQSYCKEISLAAIEELEQSGCKLVDEKYRVHHLFGIQLPSHIDAKALYQTLSRNKIFVSLRGNTIRVAPHLYNTIADLMKLSAIIKLQE